MGADSLAPGRAPVAEWRLRYDAVVANAVSRLPLAALEPRRYGRPVPAARFITDTSLELVAHRLVFLGYDVSTVRGARLEELFEAGRRDARTVLTLSARHPRRFADVPAIVVPRGDAAGAVRAIASAHEPSGAPFSRCAPCNQALHVRHPMEARGEVPGRVLRSAALLYYCPTCGKWYWEGSHVARLRAWLARALGRDIAAGPAGGRGPAGTPDHCGGTDRGEDAPGSATPGS